MKIETIRCPKAADLEFPANAPACTCKVWCHIQSPPIYHSPISLPTMGGDAPDLFFQYDPTRQEIHVWRENGSPDFWVNSADFHTICKRYHFCLSKGLVPASPHQMGGTGQFNDPKWSHSPLGRINTPYVPPIIRHVFQNNPSLMNIQPCC